MYATMVVCDPLQCDEVVQGLQAGRALKNTAQTAGLLQSRCGNPFLCSAVICAVNFNHLTNHADLDAELLCLCECFTAKYKESVALRTIVLSLYDMVYD